MIRTWVLIVPTANLNKVDGIPRSDGVDVLERAIHVVGCVKVDVFRVGGIVGGVDFYTNNKMFWNNGSDGTNDTA